MQAGKIIASEKTPPAGDIFGEKFGPEFDRRSRQDDAAEVGGLYLFPELGQVVARTDDVGLLKERVMTVLKVITKHGRYHHSRVYIGTSSAKNKDDRTDLNALLAYHRATKEKVGEKVVLVVLDWHLETPKALSDWGAQAKHLTLFCKPLLIKSLDDGLRWDLPDPEAEDRALDKSREQGILYMMVLVSTDRSVQERGTDDGVDLITELLRGGLRIERNQADQQAYEDESMLRVDHDPSFVVVAAFVGDVFETRAETLIFHFKEMLCAWGLGFDFSYEEITSKLNQAISSGRQRFRIELRFKSNYSNCWVFYKLHDRLLFLHAKPESANSDALEFTLDSVHGIQLVGGQDIPST